MLQQHRARQGHERRRSARLDVLPLLPEFQRTGLRRIQRQGPRARRAAGVQRLAYRGVVRQCAGPLHPHGHPPLWDPTLCAAEVRRVAAKGCHWISFTENPATLGFASFHSPTWDPMWEAVCENVRNVCAGTRSIPRPGQAGLHGRRTPGRWVPPSAARRAPGRSSARARSARIHASDSSCRSTGSRLVPSTGGTSVRRSRRFADRLDRRVVGDIGHDVGGTVDRHGGAHRLERIESEMHGHDVRSVDTLVDLRAIEPPRPHGQWHVLIAVVVVVEGRAFSGRVQNAQSDHGLRLRSERQV